MADYTEKQSSAFDTIKAKGGPVTILRANPAAGGKPWEGTNQPPLETAHFAVFVPGKQTGVIEALIPGFGLEFELTNDMRIRNQSGQVYKINKSLPLNLDGSLVILYSCEVARWPGA